jgi:hypothetical protein
MNTSQLPINTCLKRAPCVKHGDIVIVDKITVLPGVLNSTLCDHAIIPLKYRTRSDRRSLSPRLWDQIVSFLEANVRGT